VVGGVDAIGVALAGYGQPGPPGAALAQVLGPQRQPGPLDELKARARTYDAVARTRDVRHRAFLRTALRTERDPALRMVIADALLRLDPEDGASARLFLENLETGPDGFGRLRALAQDPPAPTATLGSLLRLSGEGSADALAKLVEVVAQAKRDEGLRAELLAPLGEVARNAPDELIAVLQTAREETLPAALDVLAAALVLETGEHPLPPAIARAERSADPVRAAFARSLADSLQHRMAAERARSAAPGPVPSVAAP
jgi:D-alanyl-D-alanine carboxypeptidase/D-alanyl-D-alanine-endopeptidase (penicillin-binding protein 4)